jgi:hypothetical protein
LVENVLGQRAQGRDGLVVLFLVDQDDPQRVLGLPEVRLRIDCNLCVACGFPEATLVDAASAKSKVEQCDG